MVYIWSHWANYAPSSMTDLV